MSAPRGHSDGVVMVLDMGTSSVRAGLVDRHGSVLAVASRLVSLAPGPTGASDLDVSAAWREMAAAVNETTDVSRDRSLRVLAVSATSVRGAFALLDEHERPIWACGSIDGRARDLIAELRSDEAAFHAQTGQRAAYAASPRLRWLAQEHPDLWRRARSLVTLDSWMLRRLTGVTVVPIVSAAPTGLLDAATSTWLEPGVESWRPDSTILGMLPPLVESGTTVGAVSASAARETGLEPGLPVVAGGGDAQMATLGTGCVDGGDRAVVMGSHWQAILTIDEPGHSPDARFRVIRGPIRGTWQADAIALGAGLHLDQFVEGLGGGADHAELAIAAEDLGPGAGGILAVGAAPLDLQGPWANAAPTIIGTPSGGPQQARAAAWRAIVEAGCLVTSHNLEVLWAASSRQPDVRPVRVGGGASRSDLVCQILASVLGREVVRGGSHQSSLLGAAVCAGVSMGWYPDLASGARVAGREVSRFDPDLADHEAYRDVDVRWGAALEAQVGLALAGVTRPIISLPS